MQAACLTPDRAKELRHWLSGARYKLKELLKQLSSRDPESGETYGGKGPNPPGSNKPLKTGMH